MTLIADAITITRKDLLTEWRVRRTAPMAAVLAAIIVVVLALATRAVPVSAGMGIASIWIALLFAGTLGFERAISSETSQDAMVSLLLAPVDRTSLYLGKLLTSGALCVLLAAIVTPMSIAMFQLSVARPLLFLAAEGCGVFGLACVGTLLAAAGASGRLSAGMFTTLVLPLTLPVLLSAVQVMEACCGPGRIGGLPAGIGVLLAFDVVFFVCGWLFYELLLE